MFDFRRARLVAPVAHILVFSSTWLLFWLQSQPLLDGPARFPFAVVFVADFPISIIAFNAVALWGTVGTLWWYFLGGLVDDWRPRSSKFKE
jgi:hypothetical protein